VLQNMDKMC